MYQDIGLITEADALNDPDPLFDDMPAGLPADLTAKGWNLIIRAPGRMLAVSSGWGCTGTKTTIDEVVTEARGLVRFCQAMNRKRS